MTRLLRLAPLALLIALTALPASAQIRSSPSSPSPRPVARGGEAEVPAALERPGALGGLRVLAVEAVADEAGSPAARAATHAATKLATAEARRRADALTAPAWYRDAPARLGAPTITVNTLDGGDDGSCDAGGTGPADDCSVLEAATLANSDPGLDVIAFSVSGTIALSAGLVFTEAVHLDGTTAPGGGGSVFLDGQNTLADVVTVSGGTGTLLDALTVGRGVRGGIRIVAPASGVTVRGSYIGTDAAGADLGSGSNPSEGGILIDGSAGNTVGGLTAGAGNTIGFNRNGIGIAGAGATGNVVQGNFIGTNAAGADFGNDRHGVSIQNASSNTVGGAAPGAGNTIGFFSSGVVVSRYTFQPDNPATGNVVEGNFIGTNAAGANLGRSGETVGVSIQNASSNTVGGAAPGAGNTIGFVDFGVSVARHFDPLVFDDPTSGNVVQGNFIGTNAAGASLALSGPGVNLQSSSGNTVGGAAPGEGNTIGPGESAGIQITGTVAKSNSHVVRGNFIGTNAAGADLGRSVGIYCQNGESNWIGGYEPGEGNTIGFNSYGIVLSFGSFGTIAGGNYVGTNAAGDDLGNDVAGIFVEARSPVAIAQNVVRFNGVGITVWGDTPVDNPILRNQVSDNDGLGIDLGEDGVTANDPGDGDGGPNDRQNFPVLTSRTPSGSDVEVGFTLDSAPSTSYRVELFASPTADPSGFGEGARLVGVYNVDTDATGAASGTLVVSGLAPPEFVTATATAIDAGAPFGWRGTSEFSAAAVVTDAEDAPDLMVDTAADDQPYDAAASLAACTDGVPDGDCTLREALQVANANADLDWIGFGILEAHGAAPSGLATVRIAGALAVTDAGVTIDGTTQTGWAAATATTPATITVVIDGSDMSGFANGLVVLAADVTVRGLGVHHVSGYGVFVQGAATTGVAVVGNQFGTDAAGAHFGNTFAGLGAFAPGVTIGGTAPEDGNTFGYSTRYGLYVGSGGDGTVIVGNHVGTNEAGAHLGNGQHGIVIESASDVTVGGTAPGAGNTIGKNGLDGISVYTLGTAARNVIAGNYIGTNAAGADLGNGSAGVLLQLATDTVVGGTEPGAGNTVRFNAVGLSVHGWETHRNAFLGNAVSDNDGIGIDLAGEGVTANDAGDADDGPNGLQNFPVLADATPSAVAFTLDSTPGTDFRIEVFASLAADGSGHGEGARLVGVATAATDGSGAAAGTVALAGVGSGEVLAATATPVTAGPPVAFGGTSEFSAAVVVAGQAITGAEGWRMLASPSTTPETVGSFLDALWTQGFPGADAEPSAPTVYLYDETVTADADGSGAHDADDGYHVPSGAAAALPAGQGAFVYVFADDDYTTPDHVDGGFPKTLFVSGPEAPAGFDFALTYSESDGDPDADAPADGWALLGNPFQAGLDWDAVTSSATVSEAVYVYDPATDAFLTYSRSAGGALGGARPGVIAAYQGFWAKATGPTPTLTAPAAARVSGGAFYGRERAPAPHVVLAVSGAVGGAERTDRARVALVEGALPGADAADAYELAGFGPDALHLFAVADVAGAPTGFDIAAVPATGTVEVPLAVTALAGAVPVGAELTLTWPELTVPDGRRVVLVDRATGAEVDLRAEPSYTFTLAPTGPAGRRARADGLGGPPAPRPVRLSGGDGARTADGARFALRLVDLATATGPTAPAALALDVPFPNPTRGGTTVRYAVPEAGPVRVAVHDALGREVAVLFDGARPAGSYAARVDAGALAPGVYVVRLSAPGGVVARSLTVVR